MSESKRPAKHIVLTSHPRDGEKRLPISWGAADPRARGPVIGTLTDPAQRNACRPIAQVLCGLVDGSEASFGIMHQLKQ